MGPYIYGLQASFITEINTKVCVRCSVIALAIPTLNELQIETNNSAAQGSMQNTPG